jgi:hypothetical protein
VAIDPSKGVYGTYQDSIVITSPGAPNSPLPIPVKMTISSFMPMLPQQVNAATSAGPDHTVAPNDMMSLYLTDLSCTSQPVVSVNGATVGWSRFTPGQFSHAVPATNHTAIGVVRSVQCSSGATPD